MRRCGNLLLKIADPNNVNIADEKASCAKGSTYGVRKHNKNREDENRQLWLNILLGYYHTSPYTNFKVFEPKERLIYRLPYYPDRIAHHMIMNVLEPIWKKIFIKTTYASIKGRGIHALQKQLVHDLKADPKGTVYCLKLDIRKFYPSIDHGILKQIIRKKIKDKAVLKLLDEIIDSAEGVPIGNYLSQYFANLYLAYFDHWVKEVLKVRYYYRYADDIVLLSDSKEKLHNWFNQIKDYLENKLKLQVKSNWQIFPVEARGIDYVGYVTRHKYVKLRKSTKMRMWKTIHKYEKNEIDKEKLQRSLTSYFGWLKYCNSKHLLYKVFVKTGLQDFGWDGEQGKISKFMKKWIYVTGIVVHKKYFKIQFIYNHRPYEVRSHNTRLFATLYQTSFPQRLKLSKCLHQRNQIQPFAL